MRHNHLRPRRDDQDDRIAVFGDCDAEDDETFSIDLFDLIGADLGYGIGVGTIQNDD